MLKRAAWLVTVTALLSLIAGAQDSVPHPNGDQTPVVPTVTFKLDWPGAEPEAYALTIDSTGKAAYESRGGSKYLGNPYSVKFTVSDATRDRVFQAARDLNYFKGNFDYRKGKIAFTGTKTLS